jgi:hypothetical protein
MIGYPSYPPGHQTERKYKIITESSHRVPLAQALSAANRPEAI